MDPPQVFGVGCSPTQSTFRNAFVTGPKAATSDYEPGRMDFPALRFPWRSSIHVSFLFGIGDGRTIAAADGADDIKPAAMARAVTAVWNRWVVVGTTLEFCGSGPGLGSDWTLQN